MSLMAASLLGGCASDNLKISPVNPDASQEARQLLEFLYSIRGRYTLAGQHNFISDPGRYDSVVFAMTGKHPVVWGSDFSFNAQGDNVRDYHHCGPMNLTSPWGECLPNNKSTEELRQGLVEEIKARHAEGRIITLMWHCCFPAECNDCNGSSIWTWKNRPPQLVWEELTTEGTRLNLQWKAQMNTVIPYLRQLRDARIPILWRPYHEMNGVWFWWCAKPGENGFKKLWIMTYDYLTSEAFRKEFGQATFFTATDGNHGRGVAWTANRLGQHSVVYMPKGSAAERLANIRAEGADASITDLNYDEAVRLANRQAQEKGWVMVQDTAWEGYTDIPLWIMQGYMTMGYEIVRQLEATGAKKPTHVFLQAGVGSMAGAMTGFLSSYYGSDRPIITVVEPNKADCVFRTAEANDGKLHFVTGEMNTIMAGLACGEPCTIGWEVLRNCADAFISCPDYAAADGMRILAAPVRGDQPIVSGESGAATVGCVSNILLRKGLADFKEKLRLDESSRVLFISTEGDTDKENYRKVVWGGKYSKVYDEN